MATTRSSTYRAAKKDNPPPKTTKSGGGRKRKAADSSPNAATKPKRGRPFKASEEHKTREEANEELEDEEPKKSEDDESKEENGQKVKPEGADEDANGEHEPTYDSPNGHGTKATANGDEHDDETKPAKQATELAIEEDKKREQAQPDNVMEKGIIYFFSRGRVDVDDPESPQDLQRSYMVMRPLPPGGTITDGAIPDVSNNRLIALPKKVWPRSGRERYMAFIEKAGASMDTLREQFFQGSEHATKTAGVRHTPGVTPIGEGVYALVRTGRGRTTSHLAYMLTIPQEMGGVQTDMGLAKQGSFIVSAKNPEFPGPPNARMQQKPAYPPEITDEFGHYRWLPAHPGHLDYAHAQVLLVGESPGIERLEATEADAQDDGKETPVEELEELEHEDDARAEHLQGDATIFADLGVSGKDYPLMTTW